MGDLAMHGRSQPSRRGRERRDNARGQSSLRGKRAPEAADVACYIADMTAQMGAMAAAARLDFLAYLLSMARAESEAVPRRRDQG